MPTRRRKLSVVHVDGVQGSARSKTAKRGNFLRLNQLRRGPKYCTNHVQRMSQINAMLQIERTLISPSIE